MDASSTLDAALELFRRRFGHGPQFAALAPGRVNLIGEHTDYNQGFVLPIAIDRYTIILGAPSAMDRSTFFAADLHQTFEIDLAREVQPAPGSAATYLLGVARQFQRMGHALPNLDLLVSSTIPIGTGLSSSAAVEVAFATLLEQVVGVTLDPLEQALLCQRAEHDFAGTPCGIMDMFVSSAARAGHALLIDCRTNEVKYVPFPPPGTDVTLLVVNTGVRHALAGSEYATRRAECEAAAAKLGVPSLRDATLAMIGAGRLSDVERRRALHVIAENDRTVLFALALAAGELERCGALMFASHDSLRDLFQVSCPELDCIVAAGKAQCRNGGVIGARMTGGGFGGCAIVLCHSSAADQAKNQVGEAFTERFGRAPTQMFTIAAAGGAHALSCAR